ncbi:MAG: glycosyltransferase family 39 protein [Gammaproteobacteria bacterium]|nr:glycosyltransferase family 39 protein [Gammaproteobacteria bacterium]
MTSRPTVASDSIPLWLLILLAAAWILPGLIGHEPWKPDEAYSFGIVYHILQTGDWIVPTLAGEPFMEKPPFFYLTAAGFAWLLSPWLPLHDGAHLAAGFYMALTLFFVYRTAHVLYGRGTTAVLALLACLGLAPLGHLLITDLALLTGFSIGLYGFALALTRKGWGGALVGTGAGIAFLSKGLIGPGLIGLVALALPLVSHAWRTRAYAQALAIATAASLPWLLIWPTALYVHSPLLFDIWLWDNNFGRFLGSSGLGPRQDAFFYLRTLPWFAWPAWALALWGGWSLRADWRTSGVVLPSIFFAVVVLVITTATDARQVYALPLLLPLALLTTPALDRLARWATNGLYALAILAAIGVAALIWLSWSAFEFGIPATLLARLGPMAIGDETHAHPLVVLLALGYTGAAATALYVLRHRHERSVASWAVVTTLAMGLTMTLLLGWLDERKGYHRVFTSLKQSVPASYRCVASYGLGEPQRAMIHYYVGIKTHRLAVSSTANCDLLLRQEFDVEAPQNPREWKLLWEGRRPHTNDERFRLYLRLKL